jgi:predicted ATPase
MRLLETISLSGFRSIKQLDSFQLGPITVLIGANGSGKSNLIGFFLMMRNAMHGALQIFLQEGGGASNFLHFGPSRTPKLSANLDFLLFPEQKSTYRCELGFVSIDRMIFMMEEAQSIPVVGVERSESGLAPGNQHRVPEIDKAFIQKFLGEINIFHFQDTSMTSRMRNYCHRDDASFLRADGGNLAAVLFRLHNEFPANYRRIVAGVNTVFPELKDFHLKPSAGNGTSLLLRWRPTSNPTEVFGPSHLSDGTIRMMALVTLFNLPLEMAPTMIILDEPELGLHPAAEAYLSSLIRSASTQTQVLLSTQSATLVDHFKPSEVVVAEMHEGASTFNRLDAEKLGHWLKRYTLGEAWRKNVFGGRPE